MGRPYSFDIRSKVVAAVEAGVSRQIAAKRFGVSAACAVRWVHANSTTGSFSAKLAGGSKPNRINMFREKILETIGSQQDITCSEIVDILRTQHGASFSTSTVARFLNQHGKAVRKNEVRYRAAMARRGRPRSRKETADNHGLERINFEINWQLVDALIEGLRPARTGRPPYAPLLMVRVLLRRHWYGLTDVEVAEALADRLSFRSFCGLDICAATPDNKTVNRFRVVLERAGLMDVILAEIIRQIDARSLVIKHGKIVNATVTASTAARIKHHREQIAVWDAEAVPTFQGTQSVARRLI